MYGSNLQVETTGGGRAVNFSDLSTEISESFLSCKIFDETDYFDFSPINSVQIRPSVQERFHFNVLFA